MCGINIAYFTHQNKEVSARSDQKVTVRGEDVKKAVVGSNGSDQKGFSENRQIGEEVVTPEKGVG